MTDWATKIAEATKNALGSMPENELAYLALTTKSEGPMRDRIAFYFHKEYQVHGPLVAREWSKDRLDLAFVQDTKPICLVELKAIYTVDALRRKPWFIRTVNSDFDKLAKHKDVPNKFGLILGTHIHQAVPRELRGIVKYDRIINRGYTLLKRPEAISAKASAVIRELYGDRIVCEGKPITAGSAFGLDVAMYYWLICPAV